MPPKPDCVASPAKKSVSSHGRANSATASTPPGAHSCKRHGQTDRFANRTRASLAASGEAAPAAAKNAGQRHGAPHLERLPHRGSIVGRRPAPPAGKDRQMPRQARPPGWKRLVWQVQERRLASGPDSQNGSSKCRISLTTGPIASRAIARCLSASSGKSALRLLIPEQP